MDEDLVTGSAHCELAPYWAQKLSKNSLKAKQLSASIELISCHIRGDRVLLTEKTVGYMRGKITL